MASHISMSAITSIDATAQQPIGSLAYYVDSSGRTCTFRYVKHIGADSAAVGKWACHATTYGEVSMTAATSLVNAVSSVGLAAGVYQAILTTNTWGWVQTSGPGVVALAVTDGNVAAGDPLVVDAAGSPVGDTDTMADGEEESVCGWARAADSGTTQTAGTYDVACEKFW